MTKYFITGVSGFVGGHYLEYLFAEAPDAEVCGVDISRPQFDPSSLDCARDEGSRGIDVKFYQGSLLDKNWVRDLIKKLKPSYIVNLASSSSVAYSWENPLECLANNTNIFLNVILAVRDAKINPRILSVGSSEEYGRVKKKAAPLTESHPLNPVNPYAISRVAQEYLSRIYAASRKIPIVSTRSFNHIGPRQRDIFAVSSFAKQVVEAKMKRRRSIVCGDLSIVRDFTDVRDVVRAYDMLLRKGRPGEVYNVSSGEGHRLSEVLTMLQKKAGTKAPVKRAARLVRPADNPVMVGSSAKLTKATGFKRKYTLSQSLDDILSYWEERL